MRKVLLSAVSVASLGLALSVAQAADIVPEAEPECVWCGFHIGVGGGAGYNFYDADSLASLDFVEGTGGQLLPPGDEFSLISNFLSGDELGAWYGFGTVEIGFDFQFADSPLVLGILASYDFNGNTDAEADGQLTLLGGLDPDLANLNSRIEVETDDAWFLGGRIGFSVFNNASLLYVLGGYTWMDASVESEHSLDVLGTEVASFTIEEDDSVDGWTLGGGIETLVWENVSLKVEYRHDFLDEIDFEDRTVLAEDDDDGDQLVLDHDGSVDFGRDTIRAVLSWRMNPFDW